MNGKKVEHKKLLMSSNCNTHSKKKKLSNVWESNRKIVTKKLMKKTNFYKKTNFLITIYIEFNKFNGNIWRVILQFNFISFFVFSFAISVKRGRKTTKKQKSKCIWACVCDIWVSANDGRSRAEAKTTRVSGSRNKKKHSA